MRSRVSQRRSLSILAAASLSVFPPLTTAADTNHYFVGPANSTFSSTNNWSLTPAGPPGSPPLDQDNAIVSSSSPFSITVDASPNNVSLKSATFVGTTAAPLTVTQTGSLASSSLLIGSYTAYTADSSAAGNFSGTGQGALTVDGPASTFSVHSPSATFSLHGGLSVAPNTPATASFSLSSGRVSLEQPAYLGGLGAAAVSITGGSLANSTTYLDAVLPSSVSQAGGAVTSNLSLGRNASYSLSAGTLSANTPNAITFSGTFAQSGGSASFANVTGTGSISLFGTASFSSQYVRIPTLTLAGSATAKLRSTLTTSIVSTLTLSDTATLDLTTHTLQLNHGFASPLATIRNYIFTGRLTSSSADAARRLAYTDNPTSLTLQLALAGDINLDGTLNPDDYALLDRSFARQLTDPHWTDGDFNYDGTITDQDYLLIDRAFASTHPHSLTPDLLATRESQFGPDYVQSLLLTSLPEPGLSLAVTVAAIAPLRRRRRS